MRRLRKRLARNAGIVLAYACTVALAVGVTAFPVGRRPDASVVVTNPARAGPTGYASARAPRLIGTAGMFAIRSCFPWVFAAETSGDEDLLRSSFRDALFALFGIRLEAPGPLAGGIPVMAYARLDVYAEPAGEWKGDREPAAAVIAKMPGSGPAQPFPGGPAVGIYHTHARESFLPELPESDVLNPDDAHSSDPAFNVIRLGRETAYTLNAKFGVGTVHSPEIHDLEGKLGAYIRSETTVRSMIGKYPSVKVLLDMHRDSQPRERTTVEFKGGTYARVMVVVGTDNPSWRENERFGTELLRTLDGLVPGISSGVYPKPGDFNQGYCSGALILEVGGVENTLEECLRTCRVIAQAVAELLRAGRVPG
ncbi:MAG: stage II sporulation protein P [Firmicutes bacterium]|nr:stage II sporulation protein P [Bacillota bacterium]